MPTREEVIEQTRKTRQILMDSALELTAESGFASVSLRSVARTSGIAATSFYRHFRDMDELGVELVMEVDLLLEAYVAKLRSAAENPPAEASAGDETRLNALMTRAVDAFLESVRSNWNLFLFFFQAYTGSSEKIRRAVFQLLSRLETDIGLGVIREIVTPGGLSEERMRAMAETLILFLLHGGIDMIARKKDPHDSREQIQRQARCYLRGVLTEQDDA